MTTLKNKINKINILYNKINKLIGYWTLLHEQQYDTKIA